MQTKISRLAFYFCSLILLLTFAANAQTASFRGFVYYKETGEAAPFVNVFFKGTKINATTDINGLFVITKIPPGSYTFFIKSIGYDSISEPITLKKDEIANRKFYLKGQDIELGEAEVTADATAKEEDTRVSTQQIDPAKIIKMPSVGEPDLAQYLQLVPGVTFTGDQGGQLYIRGGSAVQNKVLMDGMIVYNPFHSIGLFSVFDADIIRSADVYTGGFNAEYGGRISSIMDITTRDGNKNRISGKASASTFGARLLLEGPLVKAKKEDGASLSYLVTYKNSYLPQSSKILYPYINKDGLPFGFSDLYGKVSLNTSTGSKMNVFGYNFSDNVNYKDLSKLGWKSYGFGTNFVAVPSSSNTLFEGNFAYSQYGIDASSKTDSIRHSDINGFNLGIKSTNFIGKQQVKYGLEMIGFKTSFKYFNAAHREFTQEENTTEIALFTVYKFVSNNKKLLLEPGFRAHYYASLSEFSPEPRLAGKYNISKKWRAKFATGMYSQNLISANSDRDVVNLFSGYLSGPDNLQSNFTDEKGNVSEVKSRLQKANHFIFGVEYDIFKNIEMNVEVYQKTFKQLTNINRDKIYDETNPLYANKPDYLKKDYVIETGYARGLDVTIKLEKPKYYFWVIYSLGYNHRWDGVRSYKPIFDRRHNVNLVASYTLDKRKHWEFNVRWNFGTGFPLTPTQGFYSSLNTNGNPAIDPTTQNGTLAFQLGDFNSQRLPTYHRLDLGIKFNYKVSEKIKIDATVGTTNVYNRKNVFFVDRLSSKVTYQLPVLPNANIVITF